MMPEAGDPFVTTLPAMLQHPARAFGSRPLLVIGPFQSQSQNRQPLIETDTRRHTQQRRSQFLFHDRVRDDVDCAQVDSSDRKDRKGSSVRCRSPAASAATSDARSRSRR